MLWYNSRNENSWAVTELLENAKCGSFPQVTADEWTTLGQDIKCGKDHSRMLGTTPFFLRVWKYIQWQDNETLGLLWKKQ